MHLAGGPPPATSCVLQVKMNIATDVIDAYDISDALEEVFTDCIQRHHIGGSISPFSHPGLNVYVFSLESPEKNKMENVNVCVTENQDTAVDDVKDGQCAAAEMNALSLSTPHASSLTDAADNQEGHAVLQVMWEKKHLSDNGRCTEKGFMDKLLHLSLDGNFLPGSIMHQGSFGGVVQQHTCDGSSR